MSLALKILIVVLLIVSDVVAAAFIFHRMSRQGRSNQAVFMASLIMISTVVAVAAILILL